MALRRTLALRSLFSTAHCYQPSYSFMIIGHDSHEEKSSNRSFLHESSFSSSVLGRSSSHLTPFGVSIFRSLSTSNVPGPDESVAGTLTDVGIDSVVRFDVVQQMIDYVHSFTGFNWWASIVVTTLLVRGVMIPLMIYNELAWSWLMMLGPHSRACQEIEKQLPYSFLQGGDPAARDRHLNEIDNFVMELTLWIAIECDAMVGFEGTLVTLKKVARFIVIPVVILGMLLPKALNCYLMSCNIFSIVLILVKKHFGIPDVPEYKAIVYYKESMKRK